jgi:hypothetical protein
MRSAPLAVVVGILSAILPSSAKSADLETQLIAGGYSPFLSQSIVTFSPSAKFKPYSIAAWQSPRDTYALGLTLDLNNVPAPFSWNSCIGGCGYSDGDLTAIRGKLELSTTSASVYAFGAANFGSTLAQFSQAPLQNYTTGWTAGVGFEYLLSPNTKLWATLDRSGYTASGCGAFCTGTPLNSNTFTADSLKAGLSWKTDNLLAAFSWKDIWPFSWFSRRGPVDRRFGGPD